MAHSSREYMRTYMQDYRAQMRQLRAHAEYLHNSIVIHRRSEIARMVMERYEITHDEMGKLVDMMYSFVQKQCPDNTPDEQDEIIDLHLVYYCRVGVIKDLLGGVRFPFLWPWDATDIILNLERKAGAKDADKKEEVEKE